MIYDIRHSLDIRLAVRGVSLYILKVFCKVWHDELILKLKRNGTTSKYFNVAMEEFLKNKRHFLSGQEFSWPDIVARFPPGSFLRSISFLTYIDSFSEQECWAVKPFELWNICISSYIYVNPLSVNPTKWSNTLKQFAGKSQRIVWVCLTIL